MHAPRPATQPLANPWPVIAVACLSTFAGQVDASIVQLALPSFEHAFDARLDAVGWIAIAYSLAFAASLPIFARLAETAGRKRLYTLGFALFGLFSALCGFAPSLAALIACRALQGMSGALLGANSVVVLVAAAGPERRARAMGIFAGAQAVGVSAGPVAGGVLLGSLDWHYVFWASVPFAAVGALLCRRVVPDDPPRGPAPPFDWPGALLLAPALTGLMLALSKLNAWGGTSPAVLGCVLGAVLLGALFLYRERHAHAPLLQIRMFRAPAFACGTAGILLSYAMLYGMFFAISFALVRGFHEAPLAAGLRLAIVPVALGIVAPWSAGLAERRPRLVMPAGMAACGAALLVLRASLLPGDAHLPAVMTGLALYGAGLGLFIGPNNAATLAAAPGEFAGQAGGLLNLARAFATATGVAAASAMLAWRLENATGLHGRTEGAEEHALLAAVSTTMLMLLAFALLAAVAAWFQSRPRPAV